jgi:hypothetical protein
MISGIEINGTIKYSDNTEEPIEIKGSSVLSAVSAVVICSYCNSHEKENISLEINFRDQKIYYLCKQCKKMNLLDFANNKTQPLPRTRI